MAVQNPNKNRSLERVGKEQQMQAYLRENPEARRLLQQRAPAALQNPAENAAQQPPMSREEERAAFFANNPVMKQMEERQQSSNLPTETVPPRQPLGGGTREQYRPGEREAQGQAIPETPNQMQPQEQRQIDPSMLAGYQEPQQAQRDPMMDGTGLMMRGYEQQKQGAIMEQAAKAAGAETEAEAMRDAYEETLDANAEANRQMEEVNQQIQEVKDRAVALQDQMAEKKIDPDRFWNSRTTGQKVMLGIGTFLSGLGARGGENQVLDMIDTAIQRDLAAQQENYERLGERANNMVSMMSSLYKPGFEAAKMSRVMALENVKNKLNAKLATTKSQAHQAAIPKIIGTIEEEQGKEMNKVVMDRLKMQKDSKKDTELNSEQMKRLQFYKNGIEAVRGMKNALDKGEKTFELWGDNEYTLNRNYYVDSFRAGTGAAMPPYEIEFYQALAPKFTDSSEIQKKKLKKAEDTLKRQIRDIEKNYGMEPGTHLQSPDPRVRKMEP